MQTDDKNTARAPFVRRTLWQMAGAAALALPSAAIAQSMPNMDHGKMSDMDHGTMDQGKMPGMDMSSMQGGSAPPDARDPDAYSDGLEHGPMPGMDMADDEVFVHVQVDQLEAFKGKGGERGQSYDAQAWIGTDLNKLWLKSSGERTHGRLGAVRTEALYHRAIAPYWGLQAGIRQDSGEGPNRTWAAFGVQGLAPYWFDVEATAYVGSGSRTALRLEAKYDILLMQRLILEPDIEFNFYGKNDRERGIGSGLSDIEAGLRLRYEITRKVAPYVGVSWSRKVGKTADMARAAGNEVRETRVVAGIRFWF